MDAEVMEVLKRRAFGYDVESKDGSRVKHYPAEWKFFKEYMARIATQEGQYEHHTTEELIEELKSSIKFLEEEQL